MVAALLRELDELPDEERATDQLDTRAYALVEALLADEEADDKDVPAGHDEQAWQTSLEALLAEPASAADDTEWVTAEQADSLTRIFGVDWQTPLKLELNTRWGADWPTHPTEHKVAWLNDLITSGELEKSPEDQLSELAALVASLPDYNEIA